MVIIIVTVIRMIIIIATPPPTVKNKKKRNREVYIELMVMQCKVPFFLILKRAYSIASRVVSCRSFEILLSQFPCCLIETLAYLSKHVL